jgi:hypothetical protein
LTNYKLIAAVIVGALLAGCSANGTASPPTSVVAQSIGVLQFAVGTANIGQTGTVGLNTVATFRQANGLSAALVNSPTITAPAGFVVPACGTGCVDAGTTHMSSTPQNVNPNVANPVTVFGQTGGVFSYGLAPDNESTSAAVVFTRYSNPFFGSPTFNYGGGPPAYPFFKDGTFPAGFSGYSQGFVEFNATPVAGTYNLTDIVATGNAGTFTFTATGAITDLTPLPALTKPTFVSDGVGGGSGVVTVPVDGRIVETMVYFLNVTQGTFFAVGPIRGTGPQAYALPDFLGPCGGAAGTGCQNNPATQSPTFATGNIYRVYAATFDYPMFEASPPGSTSQTPAITGANGQADISTSARATATY